ncbi:hypothetical protein ACEE18_08035 [Corynebacterium freneyi]
MVDEGGKGHEGRDVSWKDAGALTREAEAVANKWISGVVLPFEVGDEPWSRSSIRRIEIWLRREKNDQLWNEFALFIGAGLCRVGQGRWAFHRWSYSEPGLSELRPVIEKNEGGGIVPVMNWIAMSKDPAAPIDVADLFHDVGLARR